MYEMAVTGCNCMYKLYNVTISVVYVTSEVYCIEANRSNDLLVSK